MTIETIRPLFANPAITVAGFAALCGIPTDTLRDHLNGRRGKRGLDTELEAKLRHGLSLLGKTVDECKRDFEASHIRLDE